MCFFKKMKQVLRLVSLIALLPIQCESIWPHPRETLALDGSPASLSESVFSSSFKSKRLSDAFERFGEYASQLGKGTSSRNIIESIEFQIQDPSSENLDMNTNVSYEIQTSEEKLFISSNKTCVRVNTRFAVRAKIKVILTLPYFWPTTRFVPGFRRQSVF